jgi:sterol desaturase/sphingolipid hydroxylase (fatty acid hydroxylase superfamily)
LAFFVPWYGFMIFYYFMHRAMHHKRLFWMHKWHHVSLVTTPMTGFSMHPAEAIGWTIGMLTPCILLAHFDLLGFWGWALWLWVTWAGNVAGHANAEIFPVRATRFSTFFMSNPISYHSLHHARFEGHYGFVAAMMDRLFHTEFSDWKELHDRVFDGQAMKTLREKGTRRDGQS